MHTATVGQRLRPSALSSAASAVTSAAGLTRKTSRTMATCASRSHIYVPEPYHLDPTAPALTPTPHRPSPKPKTSGLWRLLRRDDGALLLNSALQRHHRAPCALRARTQRRRAFRVPGLARACRTPSRILSAHRLRTDEAGVGPVKLLNLGAHRALGGAAILLAH